ncbi:ABC transporter substrate-binding protein [Pseudopelagicola sp. nBUS_19]|uniref:ABC transporter substrate-binding protein n=1 Tax=Pseudopelagicola sp. nBUS_19 TaxID=3395316 RepID=UPI003EB9FBBD
MKLIRYALGVLTITAGMAQAQDMTLTYMSWDPEQLEVEQEAIAAFEAANPGVKVETLAMPPKDYWPRLSALAAAGDLPDVFMMSSGFVKEWAAADNLADLSSVVTDAELANYYEGAASVGVINGKRVAFPQNWVAPVLYYNIDMFEAAGVPLPATDWTWEDFLSAAKSLTIDENGDGTIDQWGMWLYGRYAHIEPWVFRNGGRYLNADETALELNDEAVNALQFLTDLVNVEGVAPQPQEMEGVRQQDVMALGMAAMWVDGSWNIANVRKVAGDEFNWGIAQVPMGPDATAQTAAAYAWADLLSVGKGSENADVAWDFIQHMVGAGRDASDFLGGKVPAYINIATSEGWLESDKMPANKGLLLEIGAQNVYTGFSKSWSGWRGYDSTGSSGMNGELDEVLNGRKSLGDAIDAFVLYGNDVLSR